MVEQLHRQIKDAIRARGAATALVDHLPWVILGLRAERASRDTAGGQLQSTLLHAGTQALVLQAQDGGEGQAQASHSSGGSTPGHPTWPWAPPRSSSW